MKKTLSLILSLVFSVILITPVFAEDSSASTIDSHYPVSSEALSDVNSMVNGLLDYSPELSGSEFKIGNYIPTYTWDGTQFTIDKSALRYPVYADGKIVSFYTIINPESGDSAKQFGVEYADELNSVVNSGAEEYFLVGYDNKVFAVSEGNATLLADYGPANIDLASIRARIDSLEDSEQKVNYEEFYKMVQDKQAAAGGRLRTAKANINEGLTETDLENSVANSNISFDVNRDQEIFSSLKSIASSQHSSFLKASAGQYRYFRVGLYNQLPDKKICWAVAASRIGNFKKGESKTPTSLINYIYNVDSHKGTILDAQTALQDLYSLSSNYYTYGYTWDQVNSYIEGGTLLYGAFYDDAWTTGHAVCVNGYYTNGSNGILIMESLGGTYKQLLANSSGTYLMNYTGLGNLSWQSSLVV